MKPITKYQIINHGLENEQYFQGCGVAFTSFTEVSTGIGGSPNDALEDALESLAQNGWDTESIKDKLSLESEGVDMPEDDDDDDDDDDDGSCHWYVSVRVK